MNLDKVLHEKFELQNTLKDIKGSKVSASQELESALKQVGLLQTEVQRERLEKDKIQDELETVQESYSFVLNEMARLHRQNKDQEIFETSTQDGFKSMAGSQVGSHIISKNPKVLVSGIESVLENERDENSRLKTQMNSLSISVKSMKDEENNSRREFENLKSSKNG